LDQISSFSSKAGDSDHFLLWQIDHAKPELTDHLLTVVNICNHVAYFFELQTGRKWSTIPAFAIKCSETPDFPSNIPIAICF